MGSVLSLAADDFPRGFPADRYQAIWNRSPFTLISVETMKPTQGFAQDLVLIGVAKFGSDNIVTIMDKRSQERFTLSRDSEAHGLHLLSVTSPDDLPNLTVAIRKENEVAMIKFDPAFLAAYSQSKTPGTNLQPPFPNGQPVPRLTPLTPLSPNGQPVPPLSSPWQFPPPPTHPPPATNEIRRGMIASPQP